MESNLISIVMPAFNAEKTILESINSVINQTYSDWELIICDDGSTDKTLDIISKLQDNRITLIHNVNQQGAAGARNSCISIAKGSYIAFLDSDDVWSKEKLSQQLNHMILNDVDFSYGGYYIFSDVIDNVQGKFEPSHNLTIDRILKSCDIGCLTVMIKRSSYIDFKFPYSVKEDYTAWISCFNKKLKIMKYPGLYAYYRISQKNLSSNKIKETMRQFHVIRKYGGIGVVKSIYYISCYIVIGIIKHRFKYRAIR